MSASRNNSPTLGAFGAALFCLLTLPEVRAAHESALLTHMLVQLPLLALSGWLVGHSLMASGFLRNTDWNKGGIPGLIVAVTTLLFWMLPKSLDGALTEPILEVMKFATLPLFLGLPLALSWPRAHPIIRGLLKAQFLSMLGVLSFLYTHAPVRICNNYLLQEQDVAGLAMGLIALVMAALWGGSLFFSHSTGHRSASGLRSREAISHG